MSVKQTKQNKEVRDLVLDVRVYEGKTKEGKVFPYYKTVQKNGKIVDLKFTRDVKDLPVKNCEIVVSSDKINLDTSYLYPRYWVKEIKLIRDKEHVSKVDLSDYFVSDDLPF